MAQDIGTAYVQVAVSGRGLGRDIEDQIDAGVDGGTKKGGSRFLSAIGKWTTRAGLAGAAIVTAFTVKGGISRLMAIDEAEGKLRGLGFTAADISGVMDNALAAVRGTAFGLGDAATAAASATAAGIKPGIELERYLRLIGDAATIGGTSFTEMGAIVNKVTAQGKAGMENLNQLTERGIPIMQWLADEYGVTGDELAKMVSRGEVDAATFRKVIEDNIGGAALESGNTFRGAWANTLASLGRVGANALSGLFSRLQGGFAAIPALLAPVEAIAGQLGSALGAGIDTGVSAIGRLGAGVRDFVQSATGQQVIAALFSTLSIVVDNLVTSFNVLWPAVQNLWAALQPTVIDLAKAAFVGVNVAVRLVAEVVGNVLAPALAAAADVLASVVTWLRDNEGAAIAIATVLGVLLIPALVAWGTAALVAGAKNVAAWISSGVTALAWGAYTVATLALTIAGWVRAAAAAVASAAAQVGAWVSSGAAAARSGAMAVAAWAGAQAGALRATAATVAHKVATIAMSAATKAWTAAQWLLNVALNANPIGLIIVGLLAFGAAIYLAWTKSETFRNIVTAAWQAVQAGAMALWGYIQTALSAIGEVIGFVVGLVQGYIGLWVQAFQLVVAGAQALWSGVTSAVQLVVDGIMFYVGLVQSYIGFWVGAFQGLIDKALSLPGLIGGAIGTVVTKVGELKDKVLGAIGDVGGWLLGVGEDIMNGLLEGIDNGFQWIEDKLGGLGKFIPGWLKDVLGISSPSRVMAREVGRWIAPGVAQGIPDGYPTLRSAMQRLGDEVQLSAPGALGLDMGMDSAFGAGYAASGDVEPVRIDVHPQPGQDEEEIATMVAHRIYARRR